MMTRTTAYIGRRKDGSRVFVHLKLETVGTTVKQTTAHKPVESIVRLTVSGSEVCRGDRSVSAGGQIRSSLNDVKIENRGWTRADVESLLTIWDAWHLNDFHADCEHMAAELATIPASDYDSRNGVTCPETGYRYGSAWLVEELPADVLAEFQRLMTLPAGNVPSYVY